ncbi:hypothetical protein Ahy_B03g065443 [Arachis hypogaea]|uniref:Uncharacterized protein n=1 Tax=Arachis hypogaea TaxID=3818 RepID=A0A445A1N1_ARAHY|nr:hypothetical protein Ahy_B03g065443 [Arachis hypogaea]
MLLAPLENAVFQFRLFRLYIGDVGGGGSVYLTLVQDDPPLAPPPIHDASPVEDMDMDNEDCDKEYVMDRNDSGSSEDDDKKEFVLDMPAEAVVPYILPPPPPSPALFYGEDDYNLDVREVLRVGRADTCLAPTMSQDHRQLDIILIYSVILLLIQPNPSVSIPVLQGAVRQSYHLKPSYRKVWMESYNKVPKQLQALQSCCPVTICELRALPYHNGYLMLHDYSMFDKVFWAFPSCVEAFKQCKLFVSINGTHLYGKYGGVLLIVVAQDGNINILLSLRVWSRGLSS